ncbi:protein of unknown function [Fulvimarina manganoxydans]|uniref:Type I restriction enzyme HindI endonuclease subunit-like C-terminal domain-containing protein n=1 Tax=Fulvimarina manganoxydans TaxID=937218 RepID=A0A1W2AQK7_9HYPH|nr:protein of unknown function [Fulvimarina manganoxydans]
MRTNVVQHELFSARLQDAIKRYHDRSVDALQVLQELIALAKDLKAQPADDLSPEERAFYDALAKNDSARELMSNENLRVIATELVLALRGSTGPDWWKKENVRARMRRDIKRILKKYGYPPDLQSEAVRTILRQAETLAEAV